MGKDVGYYSIVTGTESAGKKTKQKKTFLHHHHLGSASALKCKYRTKCSEYPFLIMTNENDQEGNIKSLKTMKNSLARTRDGEIALQTK